MSGPISHKIKLGKKGVRHDDRTLRFEDYLIHTRMPHPPPAKHWSQVVKGPWGMMKNDVAGCCTISAAGHAALLWSSAAGKPKVIPDPEIIKAYTRVTAAENDGRGYDPATGANDNGCYELDVLNDWRQNGVGGDKLGAFAALEPKNYDHVKDSISIFALTYIGLALPLSAQAQTDAGKVWSVPTYGTARDGAPGGWGGHAVPVVDFDRFGLVCVTWGQLQRMTWNFWRAYCDEAYCLISQDFFSGNLSASGFNLQAMTDDLRQIGAAA
jgi:hypothetical protein